MGSMQPAAAAAAASEYAVSSLFDSSSDVLQTAARTVIDEVGSVESRMGGSDGGRVARPKEMAKLRPKKKKTVKTCN